MDLVVELTPPAYAEVGRPVRAVWSHDGRLLAIASTFDKLYLPGRAVYYGHSLRHRVSLYDDQGVLLDWLQVSFPICDIALHPTRPVVALATGAFDGGYYWDGHLVLWDRESGPAWSVLSEGRAVARCAFLDGGKELAVELWPVSEDDPAHPDMVYRGSIADLRPFDELGLRKGERDPRLSSFRQELTDVPPAWSSQQAWFDVVPPDLEVRQRIWDVAWVDDERIAAVHNGCHVEVWNLDGRREVEVRGDGAGSGHGVQLLRRGGGIQVHVMQPGYGPGQGWSRLSELRDGRLHPVEEFDEPVLLSTDRHGRLLARHTRQSMRDRPRVDRVLDQSGEELLAEDLGHFDAFNHTLRVDGEDRLYFLRGTPADSHQHKRLCAVEDGRDVVQLGPWDADDTHLMCGWAIALPGGDLVRSVHGYRPNDDRIDRLHPESGRIVWSVETSAPATDLAVSDGRVAYALTDGTVGVLDAAYGTVLEQHPLTIDDVPSVGLSLEARGDLLAVGTVDGRVLVLRLPAAAGTST